MRHHPPPNQPFSAGVPDRNTIDMGELVQSFANVAVRVVDSELDPARRLTDLDVRTLHALGAAIVAVHTLQQSQPHIAVTREQARQQPPKAPLVPVTVSAPVQPVPGGPIVG